MPIYDPSKASPHLAQRLSCRTFAANAVRLQLHAPAYNLADFMRALTMPKTAEPWSLASLRERLIKISAKVTSANGRNRGATADIRRAPPSAPA
jgi:hypothetical protein